MFGHLFHVYFLAVHLSVFDTKIYIDSFLYIIFFFLSTLYPPGGFLWRIYQMMSRSVPTGCISSIRRR